MSKSHSVMDADPLHNPDNGKITVNMLQSDTSLRAISEGGIDRLNAEISRGRRTMMEAAADPVAGKLRREGTSQGTSNSIMPGDKVYDKKHRKEGHVREISASAAKIKLSSGEKKWVSFENLVKI